MRKIISAGLISSFLFLFISSCHNTKIEINSVQDLKDKTIGCQAGTTGESFLNENSFLAKPFRDAYEACLALKEEKIDAMIIDEYLALDIVKNNHDLEIVDLNFPQESYAVAVRKNDKALLNSINSTINSMNRNGTFKMLKKAFLPLNGEIIIPEIEHGKYSETVRMGTNASYPPFEYTNGTEVVGFDVSFATYIANDYKKNLKIIDMSFASLFDALEAGSIDFICAGLTVNENRKALADFSETYFSTKQVIIVRK